ncbi:MAG: hypothetical protein ACLUFV_09235 [Acutalibacteraceae bacterium]
METEKGSLSVQTENIFPVIKRWLYSDKDIFIREAVSNAADAITKLKRLVSLAQAGLRTTPTASTSRSTATPRPSPSPTTASG